MSERPTGQPEDECGPVPAFDRFEEMKHAMHQLLRRLGDNWSVSLLELLDGRSVRFSDAARAIDGISEKMLTRTLRTLERDGFVKRTVHPVVPPRVEYELTALGVELYTLVATIQAWVSLHAGEISTSRQEYDVRCD